MPKYFRIVFLGGRKAGKTSLLQQLAYGSDPAFKLPQDPGDTIEDIYSVMADNEQVTRARIYCHDTAGLPFPLSDSAAIVRYLQICDAIVLVYSVTDRQTFALLDQIKSLIDRHREKKNEIPLIVMGNKCDRYRERLVPMEEGHTWAARERVKHYETSAHDRNSILTPVGQLVSRLTAPSNKSTFPKLGSKKSSGISLEL